jgi:hypothetical protein
MARSPQRSPKVSVVVTARNDNHGGGFLRRMQIFATAWMEQCERHRLSAELIVVEWNPMEGMKPLHEALTWPDDTPHCSIRFIEVSREIHNSYVYGDKLGLYQMIAKNVGIRRSLGEFVLCTNIDLLFSDALMEFMVSQELREGCVYRVDRLDIPAEIPDDAPVAEQLKYCEENLLRINGCDGTTNVQTGQRFTGAMGASLEAGRLHFNACGDFTLMSKKDWYKIRGYAEYDMYSPHLDSLSMLCCHYAGIEQIMLQPPMATYHIEHGLSMIAEKAGALFRTFQEKGVAQLSVLEMNLYGELMQRNGRPILFNREDWGFAKRELPETLVRKARWQDSQWPLDYEQQLISSEVPGLLSVVMATKPTAESLSIFLDQVAKQEAPQDSFEVLVPRTQLDGFDSIVTSFSEKLTIRSIDCDTTSIYVFLSKAIEFSLGEQILFLAADSRFDGSLIQWHQDFHRAHPTFSKGERAAYSETNYGVVGPVQFRQANGSQGLADAMTQMFCELRLNPDSPNWRHFNPYHFSCNRDVLIRFGGFDASMNELGFEEMGYRALVSELDIAVGEAPTVYREADRAQDWFAALTSKGQSSLRFSLKHPGGELAHDLGIHQASQNVEQVRKPVEEILNSPTDGDLELSSEELQMMATYHFSAGVVSALSEQAAIKRDVCDKRWQSQANRELEKQILVITDELPARRGSQRARALYHWTTELVKNFRVTVILRDRLVRPGDIDEIKAHGIVVFSDPDYVEDINEASILRLFKTEITVADYRELLIVDRYDCVLMASRKGPSLEMSLIREKNAGLPVGVLAFERTEASNTGRDIGDPDFTLFIGGNDSENFESTSSSGMLLDALSSLQTDKLVANKMAEYDLTGPQGMKRFIESPTRSTLVIVLETMPVFGEPSSLQDIGAESYLGGLTTVYAIAHDICGQLASKVCANHDFFFSYSDAGQLDAMTGKLMLSKQAEYFGFIKGSSFVTAGWYRRLEGYLERNDRAAVISPTVVDLVWHSRMEFERACVDYTVASECETKPVETPDLNCMLIQTSAIPKKVQPSLKHILVALHKGHGSFVLATDTLVAQPGAANQWKQNRWPGFEQQASCSLSCIVFMGEARVDWQVNLAVLQEQVEKSRGAYELIVVDRTADSSFTKRLTSWCDTNSALYIHEASKSREKGINQAIQAANGELIAFFDGKSFAEAGCLEAHEQRHQKLPEHAGIFGMVDVSSSSDFGDWFREQVHNHRMFEPLIPRLGPVANTVRLKPSLIWTFNNTSIKRHALEEVGLIDSNWHSGIEAYDYGCRLESKGHFLAYVGKAKVTTVAYQSYDSFCEDWRNRQKLYALYSFQHPSAGGSVTACRDDKFRGKQQVYEKCLELIPKLEGLGKEARVAYKWSDGQLLHCVYETALDFVSYAAREEVWVELLGEGWETTREEHIDDDEGYERANQTFVRLLEACEALGDLNFSAAKHALIRAEELGERSTQAAYIYGCLEQQMGNPVGADHWFAEAVQRTEIRQSTGLTMPTSSAAFYGIQHAMVLLKLRRVDEARQRLEDVIHDRCPVSLELKSLVFSALALCHKVSGQMDRSARCMEEASRLKQELGVF